MVSLQRQHIGRRPTALALVAVFTLGFGATFLHVENAQHTYCRQHQQFTHDQSHTRSHTAPAERAAAPTAPARGDDTPEDHEPSGCEWLNWLHSNASSLAQLQPHLFVLPPPRTPAATPIPKRHQFTGHPVERRHLSPINSPPVV
ncbi:MAG: hypothetical protein ABEN55_14590 [Bradymonadaceae bacterium]